MQLDLCLYRRGTLAEAIYWSLRNTCDHIRPATFIDYQERATWLLGVFGESAELADISYERLLKVSKDYGPGGARTDRLMVTTIKKRFVFLHKVMTEATGRRCLVEMPMFPKLRCDGRARKRIHTQLQFEAMRAKLDEPWQTWATIGWYTGMHTYDLNRARERWFKLDEPYRSTSGEVIAPGQWLRHNHKTDAEDEDLVWLPMDQGLHDWLSARVARGAPPDKVCGRFWKAPARIGLACEQAEVPRISPIDLRRSRASIWSAEGRSDEWIRIALGHKGHGWTGPDGEGRQRKALRPTIRTRHYYRPTVELIADE